MSAVLQKAIDCLKIRDVYLHSSSAFLKDVFEPKYDPDIDKVEVQFKHIVTRSSVLELGDDDNAVKLFRVFVDLGARWVLPIMKGDTVETLDIKAQIEGTMTAEYLMESDPGSEALKQFALKNASYHIWPYWREYLTTHCQRMNLPKLVIPAVQFANNQDHE
ncbi:MAG: preprotein translocase subunit SecB [Nitrosomonas sp.]|nr:preprotein translocase subunit SecB [Nitrosomonas sp.]MDP1950891.1 preprotein translocase subunit SecB [Nitrosomonas sp.]